MILALLVGSMVGIGCGERENALQIEALQKQLAIDLTSINTCGASSECAISDDFGCRVFFYNVHEQAAYEAIAADYRARFSDLNVSCAAACAMGYLECVDKKCVAVAYQGNDIPPADTICYPYNQPFN